VLQLGYKASAEQFGPARLLDLALGAEDAGFDSVAVSDHFQPFRHTGGHAPFAFAWMGALAARSKRIRIGTSVTTPTLRLHPSIAAQAFATLAGLAPGRIFAGVGTGESMNEVPPLGIDWPPFRERLGRLREAIELMRLLWSEERVTYEGHWYRTQMATIYDRPDQPPPILVAAAGPRAARFAGEVGDGFITTSGKPPELYSETLLPAVAEGAAEAGRDPDGYERLIEIKVSYDHNRGRAVDDCGFWAPLALSGEVKQGVHDPVEMERLAGEEHVHAESRFIVATEPDACVDAIGSYVDLGFRHLVFHSPTDDQERFIADFSAEVLPRLRSRYAEVPA
jgi:coenzyme F420-dependent glucose-6-phosphate dehydrogenase